MIDGIPIGIGELSGWALFVLLCVLIVTSFMRGWVEPRSAGRARDAVLEKSQDANARLIEAMVKKDASIDVLLEQGRTTVTLLEAIQKRAEK